jgi:hypothetical protein
MSTLFSDNRNEKELILLAEAIAHNSPTFNKPTNSRTVQSQLHFVFADKSA